MGASVFVPAALGALGLMQQGNYEKQALNAMAPQQAAEKAQLKIAKGYNPQAEDAMAFGTAGQTAGNALAQALKGDTGQFLSAGGIPGNDTAFSGIATNTANRTLDPLREWVAQQASTETQRKAQMYNQVYNAPSGQIAQNYWNASQYSPNYGPTLGLFSQAIGKLFAKGAAGPGAGSGQNTDISLPGSSEQPGGTFSYPGGF